MCYSSYEWEKGDTVLERLRCKSYSRFVKGVEGGLRGLCSIGCLDLRDWSLIMGRGGGLQNERGVHAKRGGGRKRF